MQSIDSIEIYGTSKDLMSEKVVIRKWLTSMMLQKENIKGHIPNWPDIPDHPYRILIIRGSGSGQTHYSI